MTPRLVTIPISHYCEKARWALDRAGIAYREQPHIQLIHIAAARRAGGGRTVPVLVTADGTAIGDSAAILRWTDQQVPDERRLYPAGPAGVEAERIEAWLDDGLGPDGRLWMYHGTLPVVRQLAPWALAGTPRWEQRGFRAFGWMLDPVIRRYLGVDDASAVTALRHVDEVFDKIAAMLGDGRAFLTGARFTAADLAFGALSAALLMPAAYGSPLPPVEVFPAPMQREVRRLREHPAGQFAARLYEQERHAAPAR